MVNTVRHKTYLDWRYHIPGKDDTLTRKELSSSQKGQIRNAGANRQ